MQRRHAIGLVVLQLMPQRIGEQVVVAVPPPLVVERHDEQVRPFELFKDQTAVGIRAA